MIAGLIGYWTSLSDKTDKELRTLSTTQSTVFMRADFQNTIKKSLSGTNPIANCPANITTTLKNTFKDYMVPSAAAIFEREYNDNAATTNINEVKANAEIKCFLNINRYPLELKWDKLKVVIRRSTEPNFMTLSNFLAVDVLAAFKNKGKPTVLKYQLKYRIDVMSLDRYGIIFTNAYAGALFDIAAGSKLAINAPVLFDEPDRSKYIPLNNLMLLPDTGQLVFNKENFTSAPRFTTTSSVISFLTNNGIYKVFKKGIEYNHLPKDSSFRAPYDPLFGSDSQWKEDLDFRQIQDAPLGNEAYPLPNKAPIALIFNVTEFARYNVSVDHSNTASIYNHMFNTLSGVSEKKLIDSCKKIQDPSVGPYHLLTHNNFDKDFTIDFTKNISSDYPPVFCGVIAAKNLIIKLNGQTSTEPYYRHHIIGKLILRGKIKIVNQGSLTIHDLLNFTEDLVEYTGISLDVSNLRTQFFNQKYYSTQNFFLPFFESYPIPLLQNDSILMSNNLNRYFFPRSSRAFFHVSCGSGFCRTNSIDSPPKEYLAQNHWTRLLYDVYDLE